MGNFQIVLFIDQMRLQKGLLPDVGVAQKRILLVSDDHSISLVMYIFILSDRYDRINITYLRVHGYYIILIAECYI